ncbi:hypothetical protein HDE_14224 [Halotydeus destructor]|nr:hypothetical protein HDE_14224 [Halotydeus destructor]
MGEARKYEFAEIVLFLLLATYTVIVVPWMAYVIFCLIRDLIKWEVKMDDLVQFLYIDLGLAIVYVIITGIRSRSTITLNISFVVMFVLSFAYFAYLRRISDQDEDFLQTLYVAICVSFVFAGPGRHVTSHYKFLKSMEQLDRELEEIRRARRELAGEV